MRRERRFEDTNPKGSKTVLFIGFCLSAVAFVLAVVPFIMFFVPNAVPTSGTPFITTATYLNAFAVALSFAGIIMSANSALHNRPMAQFSFLFGVIAFLIGTVMFILCLLFGAVIPLNRIA